jgi:dUTP diphosphatase
MDISLAPHHAAAQTPTPIVIELLHEDTQIPCRATEGSAGYDLFAYVRGRRVRCSDGTRVWERDVPTNDDSSLELAPGEMALVPLGFKARLPRGYEAQVRPRSGTAFKKGLAMPNAPGTVDSDYPDEWMVIIRNAASAPVRVAHGERIAQMVLQRYEVLEFEEGVVGATTNRRGGFGSTGT